MWTADFDVCECGDYRRQHAEGWRGCEICTENDPWNGRACLQFRLFETCTVNWRPTHARSH